MKIQTSAVIASMLGVLVAGLALHFAGDLPGLKEARRGFDGRTS